MKTVLRIEKEALKFSAAHFLIFADGTAERLHGHNYQVRAELEVVQTHEGLGLDFRSFKAALAPILEELDESFLAPADHPGVHLQTVGSTLILRFQDRFYAFPRNEVRVLPISNSSVEELARYLAERLVERLASLDVAGSFERLTVEVEETKGQNARVTERFATQAGNSDVRSERQRSQRNASAAGRTFPRPVPLTVS